MFYVWIFTIVAVAVCGLFCWVMFRLHRELKDLSEGLAMSNAAIAAIQNILDSALNVMENLNLRLIDIETDNKIEAPRKPKDEDLLNGPRSWASQAQAASLGEGVDYLV